MATSKRLLVLVVLLVAFGLRVYKLEEIPNGLFIDEAARGYDAFSISQTGADMFGRFLPLFPRGFDDYTPALYTYLTVPFVAMLDLSRFSIRYTAVWIGVFTVAVAYQAIRRAFDGEAAVAGAGLLAISPWYVLLSRIGTEWTLLGLGSMLTVVLLYRGLRRPRWLIAAGLVGGISLYGYAPVKAFLPLLLLVFVLFYRRRLLAQKRAALMALAILVVLALPVYLFSLTPEGRLRLEKVSYVDKLPWPESLYFFGSYYLAYFDPRFLFRGGADPVFVQAFNHVGLLYWFELPLILLGLALTPFQRGERASGGQGRYFWLAWLLIAPLGINLHSHSPKPALWLTSTPILHGLAGAGLVYTTHYLNRLAIRPQRRWLRGVVMALLAGLVVIAAWNIRLMLVDLFTEFPLYSISTGENWWAFDMKQATADANRLSNAFDSIIWQPFDIEGNTSISGIYYAFYSRFAPRQWQRELTDRGDRAWQAIGPIQVGQLNSRALQPGCHLALVTARMRYALPFPSHVLATYQISDRQANPLMLAAVAGRPTDPTAMQAVFGEQILLDSFILVSNSGGGVPLVKPGQAICLVLNWLSAGNLTVDYTVFVHLVGPVQPATNSPLWGQHDGMPVDGLRPTTSWQSGEAIQEMRVILVPADAPPATYQVKVGLYNGATGERLPVAGQGEDQVTLLEVKVRR